MKQPQFIEGQIYHIYNRGVEMRDIFLSSGDYYRFTHDLFEFNDDLPVKNLFYYLGDNGKSKKMYIPIREERPRKLLVEILAFCLMPNHFHLMIRQKKPSGIARFMQKIGTGYTLYFNKKYERTGVLFQGTFKAARLANERHFIHLPFYIHMNPLKLYRGANSQERMMKLLEEYRWSSFSDYLGRKNFPSVTSRDFLSSYFGGEKGLRKQMLGLLNDKVSLLEEVGDVILEPADI